MRNRSIETERRASRGDRAQKQNGSAAVIVSRAGGVAGASPASRRACVVALSVVGLSLGLSAERAAAANAYFDVNGTAAGYGVVDGGSYSWEDANWASAAGGASATHPWVQGDFARFMGTSGMSYTVTVHSEVQNAGWYLTTAGVTLTINAEGAGTLNVLPGAGDPPVQGVLTSGTLIVNAPISGAGAIQPQLSGSLHLNGVNTYSGGTKFATGVTLVYFNNGSAFGTGDIFIDFGGFVPLLGAGGAEITLPNHVNNRAANGGVNFAANANTPVISSGNWNLGDNKLRLRNSGPVTSPLTLSGVISGSAGVDLSANNNGTIILSGVNTYTGPTTIGRGNTPVTLKLGAANTIAASSQVILDGGILKPGGLNHAMTGTTLALTAHSTIDFEDGPAEIHFMDGSAVAWTGGTTLDLLNWNPPSTRLRFGTHSGGLTSAQLSQISVNGAGLGTAALDSEGYLAFPTGGPVITEQPQSIPTLCAGTGISFHVAASGTGPLTYQWYRNAALMPGETNASLMLTAGSENAQNGDQFHVVVSDDNGSTSSNVANLSVYGPPTFTLHTFNASVVPGGSATFTVAAQSHTTPETLTYQWHRAPSTPLTDAMLPGGTVVSGATTAALTLTNIQPADAGSYFATVTDACGVAVDSVAGLLTVVPQPCDTRFDADSDGDVDQADFGLFQACFTGETGGDLGMGQCRCFDVDGTAGAVDYTDLAAFEACAAVSGPDVPAGQECAGSPVLFAEDFDTDPTANWLVNKSTAPSNDAGSSADFFFDYGAIGIPPAPHSLGGTTRGLKLQANLTGNLFSGLSVSPIDQSFTGDYRLEFDLWLSHTGPLDSGSFSPTFNTNFGILSDGTTTQWVGQEVTSIMFSATNTGASVGDYRVFTPASSESGGYQDPYPAASPIYASNIRSVTGAEIRDSAHPYYSFLGGATAPAAQRALFPSLTGATPPGAAGFAWRRVKIVKSGDFVLWYMDDHLMATVDLTTAGLTRGTNILFGHGDANASSPTEPDAEILDFALFDNIVVIRQ